MWHPQAICRQDARIPFRVFDSEVGAEVAPQVAVDGSEGAKFWRKVLLDVAGDGLENGRRGIIRDGDLATSSVP